jgi:hypothetical protein
MIMYRVQTFVALPHARGNTFGIQTREMKRDTAINATHTNKHASRIKFIAQMVGDTPYY